jgi:hypothetical protein
MCWRHGVCRVTTVPTGRLLGASGASCTFRAWTMLQSESANTRDRMSFMRPSLPRFSDSASNDSGWPKSCSHFASFALPAAVLLIVHNAHSCPFLRCSSPPLCGVVGVLDLGSCRLDTRRHSVHSMCAYFLPAFTRAHLFRWPALIRASPSAEI